MPRGQVGEGVADVGREALVDAEFVGEDTRLVIAAEHEQREGRRVAADRRARLRGARVERPARVLRCAVGVAGDQARLHGPDRAPPAVRRRSREALPVGLGGPCEPVAGVVGLAVHQRAQAGCVGGVGDPRELPLPLVRIVRQARAAVLPALLRPLVLAPPVDHAASMVAPCGS